MASFHSEKKGGKGDMLIAFLVGVGAVLLGWALTWAKDAEAAQVYTVYLPIVETEPEFSSVGPVIGGG